jgi:hypothetical protein
MVVTILIISILIAALAIKNVKFQNTVPFINKPTDILIALLTVTLLVLNHLLDLKHEGELRTKEHDAIKREDSLARAYNTMLQNATNRNIYTFNEALQKYRLHYDSTQRMIFSTLQDSLYNNESKPFVTICQAELGKPSPVQFVDENDNGYIQIRICTQDALAYHIYVTGYFIRSIEGNLGPPQKFDILTDETKDAGTMSRVDYPFKASMVRTRISDTLFMYFKFKYSNAEGRSWDNSQKYFLLPATNEFRPLGTIERAIDIVKILKKQGFIK